MRPLLTLALAACAILLDSGPISADPVRVRRTEGLVHGFLALSDLDGKRIADGDLIQIASGGRVTSHLVFRFADGSIHDEQAVFTQRGVFRLVSGRLIQKGPAFPRAIDMSIDAASGAVVVRHSEKDGEEKVEREQMTIPP